MGEYTVRKCDGCGVRASAADMERYRGYWKFKVEAVNCNRNYAPVERHLVLCVNCASKTKMIRNPVLSSDQDNIEKDPEILYKILQTVVREVITKEEEK